MIRKMTLEGGVLSVAGEGERAGVWVYCGPTAEERRVLEERWGLDDHDINSALDPDEVPRVEADEDWVFLVWKRPRHLSAEGGALSFEVGSEGFVLQGGELTVIQPDEAELMEGRKARRYGSVNELLIRHLHQTIGHFVAHLRAIKRASSEIERKLTRSMENKYFLQMFSLSESLVYYLDALEANGSVLRRLAALSERLGLTEKERELLDDVLIDNRQCQRQAEIYQSVLAGLMDARGSIINNNMSVLLRNLTVINIVFLPLNLIAGIGGMSEFTMMTSWAPVWLAYGLLCVGMATLGVLMWRWLTGAVSRTPGEGAG